MSPIVINAASVRASLAYPRLVPALRQAFAEGAEVPLRHRHDLPQADASAAALLLMPSWHGLEHEGRGYAGVKLVSVFAGNARIGIPAVSSTYLLCDRATGQHLALIDGYEITGRRTAAASALAASILARPDASTMLVLGAGHIASMLAPAMRAVRPIRTVLVWNPTAPRAQALVEALQARGYNASITHDLAAAAAQADIISCASLSTAPLILGEWLRPGTHLDLVGGFTPAMREADDNAFTRGRVFMDSPAALREAGDLLHPIGEGVLDANAVATLGQLCKGERPGRQDEADITVFKSVGTGLADLAAAVLAYEDAAPPPID